MAMSTNFTNRRRQTADSAETATTLAATDVPGATDAPKSKRGRPALKANYQTLTVLLPPDLKARAQEVAAEEGTTLTQLVIDGLRWRIKHTHK